MQKTLATAIAAAALFATPLAANALVYQFTTSLSGANEVPPNARTATGIATLFYDDKNSVLTTDDSFNFALAAFGLTGVATGAHIHAPAPVGANAPIVVPLNVAPFSIFNSGGTVLIGGADVAPPYAAFLSQLQAGLTYVNVHTALFPGGEIRGQLAQVSVIPEPETYALMLAGLTAVGFVARRRVSKG